MPRRIYFDGLNLALPQGTGIATYTRMLTQIARGLGHETGVLYSTRQTPARDPVLREIAFFDERRTSFGGTWFSDYMDAYRNLIGSFGVNRPVSLPRDNVVVARQFEGRLPEVEHNFVSPNVFSRAHTRFDITGGFLPLAFETPPDIMHCTYQLPLKARGALNIVTIHDLVMLRLPFTTLDRKRKTYNLLRKIGREADHIVTVSENSRRDIIDLLGVEESRITNTYQAVTFPQAMLESGPTQVEEQLSGAYGLGYRDYLLFFGAFEPKKNISRIIDAYMESGVDIPLVLVTSQGWENDAESKRLAEQALTQQAKAVSGKALKRQVIRFQYVSRAMLVTLVRGARALVFPSLYEGFGLPVLEAMTLGTPVITANTSSLPEVAGEAALMVDPYDVQDIARGIRTMTHDVGLREALVERGLAQAEQFSPERYRARIAALYDCLL